MVTPYINFNYVNEQADKNDTNILNNNDFKDFFSSFKLKSNNRYFDMITQYLQNNLDSILSNINFPREENGSYIYSWQGNEGEISYIKDSKPIVNYLKQNKQQITNDNVDWNTIVDKYSRTLDFIQFGKKIRAYIIDLNNKIIKQRTNYLEQLNDKVNDCIAINYNSASDHERDKSIVILRIELNKKIQDKVYIGQVGQSHGWLIVNMIIPELISLHAKVPQPTTIYQAYLLGTVAFMDPNMPNTYDDLEYIKKILINDNRITKIYTIPVKDMNSGNIVRVARLYKLMNDKKKLNLGVDIDNCLNDLNIHLLKLIKKYYKVSIDESIYDVWEKLGITIKERDEFLRTHSKEIKLNTMEQCQYYLKKLQKYFNIYIITARPYSFANETLQWLKDNKIPYDDIFFKSGNKVDVCKFLNISYMIDDSPWNILSLQKNNINCLVFNQPYNQRIKNNDFVNRVYDWKDIYLYLMQEVQ